MNNPGTEEVVNIDFKLRMNLSFISVRKSPMNSYVCIIDFNGEKQTKYQRSFRKGLLKVGQAQPEG